MHKVGNVDIQAAKSNQEITIKEIKHETELKRLLNPVCGFSVVKLLVG